MAERPHTGSRRLELVICLCLIAATAGVFWQVANHDFVNYDDTRYITRNAQVQKGLTAEGILWAFTTGEVSNWHPLTWLSHLLDIEIYGLNPRGHHLTNLLFHAVNTALLFLVLRLMTGAVWRPAFVAGLFALHPLHVESVAWVAERKDVLSTFFWILTMLAYGRYVRNPGFKRYSLVVVALSLGLMAKPMLVTLPLVLLLLDYWPLRRFGVEEAFLGENPKRFQNLVWEKWPLFLLSVASSVITFVVQKQGLAVQPLTQIPLETRIENALVSYATYVWKMIWPANLSVYYPHPMDSLSSWQILGAALLLISISAAVLWQMKRRPYLVVGWLWFVGSMVPVIGLVQVGGQAMADRYTYVPLVGLFISLTWYAAEMAAARPGLRRLLAVGGAVTLSLLAVCTWFQLGHWKSTEALFEHALRVTRGNQLAHNQLGIALLNDGRTDEAIEHFSEAVRLTPQYVHAHINLGNAFKDQGKLHLAAEHYRTALSFDSRHVTANNNLGIILAMQGRTDEALTYFARVLEVDPDDARVHNNIGSALASQGKFDEAVKHFLEALRIDPDHASARKNLKKILDRQGQ